MTESGYSTGLEYQPHAALAQYVDPTIVDCRGKRIGILVVTDNAKSTVLPILKRIPPSVWHNVEEVLVFDDAGQDGALELAMDVKAAFNLPKLRVLQHPKHPGYGGHQKAGYRYFLEAGFDIVVLLPGDGQHAPEILGRLYSPLVAGEADAVFGSRMMGTYGGPLKGGMPLYQYAGNRILTFLQNRALGLKLTEFHSGYRAYNLHALAQLDLSRMTNDVHFDTEIIVKLHHQGMRIREVPIPTCYGTGLCNVGGLQYARGVLRSVRRYRRTCRSIVRAPEFAEYFVHYPIKQSRYSSHYYARQLVGRGQDVLDVGCGEGFFAAELKKDGNRIVGVDALPTAGEGAMLERYIPADLNVPQPDLARQAGEYRFDRVLLLDVLEHLVRPARLLAEVRPALKEGGLLVVSVPNVANITVRVALLFGRFNYTDRGILDRTHLNFYTRKTSRAFLEENGWEIAEARTTIMPLEVVLGLDPANPLMRVIGAVLAAATAFLPGLLGYQFVYLARPRR